MKNFPSCQCVSALFFGDRHSIRLPIPDQSIHVSENFAFTVGLRGNLLGLSEKHGIHLIDDQRFQLNLFQFSNEWQKLNFLFQQSLSQSAVYRTLQKVKMPS